MIIIEDIDRLDVFVAKGLHIIVEQVHDSDPVRGPGQCLKFLRPFLYLETLWSKKFKGGLEKL